MKLESQWLTYSSITLTGKKVEEDFRPGKI